MSLTHKLERVMIARGWDGGVGTLLMGVVFLFGMMKMFWSWVMVTVG